jgi:ABC-type multidrug transport system fused ATPase/permease subunit
LELQSGKIELGGVDLSQVRLDLLREKCFITVAQDSFILPNETLRFNLDPDGSLSTDTIIGTLVRVGLWTHFAGGETGVELLATMDHPVLDNAIASFPELSVGQSQLLSLCRPFNKVQTPRCARVKPVVLLDEVTSSLDPETEAKIYAIVNEEFTQKGHTVIVIAHRSSVLSGHSDPTKDVVAVLGNGRLQEVIREVGPATLKNIFEGR